MKKEYKIDITSPCSERLSNFSPVDSKAFCQKCSKHVIDFTKMSDREVLEHFANTTGKTCGKFNASQLKTYPGGIISEANPTLRWLGAGIMGLSVLFPSFEILGQTRQNKPSTELIEIGKKETIKESDKTKRFVQGTVIDSGGEVVPGVNVILKGTITGTTTDIDGRYKFATPLQIGDILIFSFIGFRSQEYIIKEGGAIDIAMQVDIEMACDTSILGEVSIDSPYSSKRNLWQKIVSVFK